MLALQTGSEDHIVKVFQASNLCAIHRKRITVEPKDVQCCRKVTAVLDNRGDKGQFAALTPDASIGAAATGATAV